MGYFKCDYTLSDFKCMHFPSISAFEILLKALCIAFEVMTFTFLLLRLNLLPLETFSFFLIVTKTLLSSFEIILSAF